MTTFDSHANLAYSAVATAPSPATSGTSLTVTTGQGARFPASGTFNCTVWPGGGATASPTNAEIVRVTAVATDTFTIVRAQEGTTAQAIATGYQIALTGTAKVLTDIEGAVNATLGGSLSGTLPNPTIAAGAVGTTQLALGAVTQRVPNVSTTINVTTTSATFVDVDATNAAVTLTTTGGDIFVLWNGKFQDNTSNAQNCTLAFSLDGAAEVCAADFRVPVAGVGFVYCKAHVFEAVPSGAHTIKLRWKVAGGDTIQIVTLSDMLAIEYRR